MKTKSEFCAVINNILDRRLSDPTLNVDQIAGQAGMSRMHLHRHVRRYYECSTSELINRRRLCTAWRMLSTDSLSVGETAVQVGFRDPAYFTRVFKKRFGISPREARNS